MLPATKLYFKQEWLQMFPQPKSPEGRIPDFNSEYFYPSRGLDPHLCGPGDSIHPIGNEY